MGLDYHGLSFLKYASCKGPFGKTATIGRQEVHVKPKRLKQILGSGIDNIGDVYCESLLCRNFSASNVESIDYSPYEEATHIHDMGRPLHNNLKRRYNTVIDAGTLEHVFDIAQAFRNCSDLTDVGGQILHILPANNYLGHGFWQMSPELFFSLYSEENGYRDTEVFLARFLNNRQWYKVKKPSEGHRVTALSSSELYILARTVKAAENAAPDRVQQSDYVHEWERSVRKPTLATPGLRQILSNIPVIYDRLLLPVYNRCLRLLPTKRMTSSNPGLEPIKINSLIRNCS